MNRLIIILFLSFQAACTHTSYLSSGNIPVYIGAKAKHTVKISAKGDKSFFLWGVIPEEHKVYIDKELAKEGLVSAANLKIEEYQKWDDFIVGVLSLGMFVRKSYEINAYGMMVDRE